MDKPIFSVITYNINGFEDFYELDDSVINKNAEYVYVTDNKNIVSNKWKIIYIEPDYRKTALEAAFEIRFNPFKYVTSDIVISLDGSMRIKKDLTPIINTFIDGNYDAGCFIHNERNTLFDEYKRWEEWVKPDILKKSLDFFENEGYDIYNHKGLYVTALFIQRNDDFNNIWNMMSFAISKYLGIGTPLKIERVDQTIRSYVLNKYFPDKKILPLSIDLTRGNVLSWMEHTAGYERILYQKIDYYVQNKKIEPNEVYGAIIL